MNVKILMNAMQCGVATCFVWPGLAMAVDTVDAAGEAAATGSTSWFALLMPVVAVTLAMVAMLWWLRRGRGLRGGRQGPLRVVQAVAVGSRERVVVLDAQNRRLLLGVTANRVELLAELQADGSPGAGLAQRWSKASPEHDVPVP